jgi:hypothetical protein
VILSVGEEGMELSWECEVFKGEVIDISESKANLKPEVWEGIEDEAIAWFSIMKRQRRER